MDDERLWAQREFGDVDLGDARLDYRVVCMAARAAEAPDGVIAQVFPVPRERQGAYDLLSNSRVPSSSLVGATARASARRAGDSAIVFCVIDGTSASLADQSGSKELGSIGSRRFPTRGLKFVSVYGVDERSVPLGLLGLRAWQRGGRPTRTRYFRRKDGQTEMAQQWIAAVDDATSTLRQHCKAQIWLVGDRECDDSFFLTRASEAGLFTVRAAQNRIVEDATGNHRKLFSVARRGKLVGVETIVLPANAKRRARAATLEIRISRATLLLPLRADAKNRVPLEVNVIQVKERGGQKDRVCWTLLTNAPVSTPPEIKMAVASYRARWRIEDFHRAWKAGACDVEATQLRSREAITKWATILGAVAARAERLKHLSRTEPDAPATIELTDTEIIALITAKRRIKTSVEEVPDGVPTIAKATLWIADLGGYAGHYKKGRNPGTTTIARGLERLATWTDAVATLVDTREIKRRLR